ncbi:MAG: hypothetical protein EB164_00850 [Thaumarchaeota archaeon]|nr:hypothetical protein [Nitrososphaerota archaeon]
MIWSISKNASHLHTRKGEAVMSQISSHYLAQLLDQIGVTYELSYIGNTITITVGDDHDRQFAVNLSLDSSGQIVWFSSKSRIKYWA